MLYRMMKGYGQFCPVALAAELFAERWTPLILRELLSGARRFTDIHKGLPRISRNLLAQRLDALVHTGVIHRKPIGSRRGFEYDLTEAGREFGPVIECLGAWGYKWATHDLREEHLDPDYIIWVLHKLVRTENLPDRWVVIYFQFRQTPKQRYWLILNRPEVDVCLFDPGFGVDLEVVADLRALADICLGHVGARDAVNRGALTLTGPTQFRRSFATWLGTTPFSSAAPL